ncbi:M23 family metallopeptidase [Sulfurospirillum deleyianum]|uniref:Peptidase M23 n=1 Tax=Sulfurospirillum deleyianum (strain ATCC 51133 / DSM 6946 / 5175) TaxID=525898 RepID=D1B0G1_SULD5|nr:M23 family metallopeptidase [Sulfurospirillum deleyianum]ACZ11280.1 Peptidase M23 [Sulfurospirillum deleyianum DSM 6946]
MKRKGQASIAALVLGLMFLIGVGGVVYMFTSDTFEREAPQIALAKEIEWNLKEPLKIQVGDTSGISFVEAALFDGEKSVVVDTKEFKEKQQVVDINVSFPKMGLNPNQKVFELTIKAIDQSKWNFFAGNTAEVKAVIKVDTKRPEVNIINNSYKITKGGVATVVFRAYDEAMKSLYIETNFGKKFYPTPFYKEGYYVSFVAWPTVIENFSASIVAVDRAGNISRFNIPYFLQDKKYRTSTIALQDRFLEGKISDLIAEVAPAQSSLSSLEKFKYVNEDMRKGNEEEILKATSNVPVEIIKDFRLKPFYPLRNGQVVASFGDHRFYEYNKQPVSESFHLGLDFASNAQAPMQTSNDGIVVFARENGIYGNNIIIAHGLGVYSLYGHCSSYMVKEGDSVKAGETIAKTGVTGLALGDHLHFGMYVQGVDVRPEEWMDEVWLKESVYSVMDASKKMIER